MPGGMATGCKPARWEVPAEPANTSPHAGQPVVNQGVFADPGRDVQALGILSVCDDRSIHRRHPRALPACVKVSRFLDGLGVPQRGAVWMPGILGEPQGSPPLHIRASQTRVWEPSTSWIAIAFDRPFGYQPHDPGCVEMRVLSQPCLFPVSFPCLQSRGTGRRIGVPVIGVGDSCHFRTSLPVFQSVPCRGDCPVGRLRVRRRAGGRSPRSRFGQDGPSDPCAAGKRGQGTGAVERPGLDSGSGGTLAGGVQRRPGDRSQYPQLHLSDGRRLRRRPLRQDVRRTRSSLDAWSFPSWKCRPSPTSP